MNGTLQDPKLALSSTFIPCIL